MALLISSTHQGKQKARCSKERPGVKEGTDPRATGCQGKHGTLLYNHDYDSSLVLASSGLICSLSPFSSLGMENELVFNTVPILLVSPVSLLSILFLRFLLSFTVITQTYSTYAIAHLLICLCPSG